MKTFLPEIPLNSGFYRAVTVDVGPEGTVVNAGWPTAVTGSVSGAYEKVMNAGLELWSQIMPERAMACCFNLEYLLVGGRDARADDRPFFMWYDWMALCGTTGWPAAGAVATARTARMPPRRCFGVGLAVQPLEGQERLCPVVTTCHEILPDSGGPGRHRGGCGVRKGGVLTDVDATVMSYCCDRGRSVTWGINGGLPSVPHGVWLQPAGNKETILGAAFSNVEVHPGDRFWRPSAGGGGFGDPLDRNPEEVREDVADGYVSLTRARRDYGVVVREVDAELAEYAVDEEATGREREEIRAARRGWLEQDPREVAARYAVGEIDILDCVRQHGVILNWGTGELLPRTTEQFRATFARRAVAHWADVERDG